MQRCFNIRKSINLFHYIKEEKGNLIILVDANKTFDLKFSIYL